MQLRASCGWLAWQFQIAWVPPHTPSSASTAAFCAVVASRSAWPPSTRPGVHQASSLSPLRATAPVALVSGPHSGMQTRTELCDVCPILISLPLLPVASSSVMEDKHSEEGQWSPAARTPATMPANSKASSLLIKPSPTPDGHPYDLHLSPAVHAAGGGRSGSGSPQEHDHSPTARTAWQEATQQAVTTLLATQQAATFSGPTPAVTLLLPPAAHWPTQVLPLLATSPQIVISNSSHFQSLCVTLPLPAAGPELASQRQLASCQLDSSGKLPSCTATLPSTVVQGQTMETQLLAEPAVSSSPPCLGPTDQPPKPPCLTPLPRSAHSPPPGTQPEPPLPLSVHSPPLGTQFMPALPEAAYSPPPGTKPEPALPCIPQLLTEGPARQVPFAPLDQGAQPPIASRSLASSGLSLHPPCDSSCAPPLHPESVPSTAAHTGVPQSPDLTAPADRGSAAPPNKLPVAVGGEM